MHIILSQVYCVWQIVKTPTIISNNPVLSSVTNFPLLLCDESKSRSISSLMCVGSLQKCPAVILRGFSILEASEMVIKATTSSLVQLVPRSCIY